MGLQPRLAEKSDIPIADSKYSHARREFSGGLWAMAELGNGPDIADLVDRMVDAIDRKGVERAERNVRNRGVHNYINTAVALLTLATVIFWGGSIVEKVNQHDVALRQIQSQVQTAVQVADQVRGIESQMQRLNDRIDRFLDKNNH